MECSDASTVASHRVDIRASRDVRWRERHQNACKGQTRPAQTELGVDARRGREWLDAERWMKNLMWPALSELQSFATFHTNETLPATFILKRRTEWLLLRRT